MTNLQVRPLPNERGWYIAYPAHQFETFIGGDENGPSQTILALVERALSQLHALAAKAKDHFDIYVDRQQFANGTEWYFEGITAGRDSSDALSDLWLEFSIEEDMCGFWTTRLREIDGTFHVLEFRRLQQ